MMRLQVRRIGQALHPSEVLVAASTVNGNEEQVVVDESSLKGNELEIGWPLVDRNGSFLVELPRESVTGAWRIWVHKHQVTRDEFEAIA